MLSEKERKELILKLNLSFCMPELMANKESFLNLTDEQYKASLYDVSTAILIKIILGDLEDVPRLMEFLPDVGFEDYIKPIIPSISDREFLRSVYKLAYLGASMEPYYCTACGRPSVLNGLRDFSYHGNFVLKHKERTLALLKVLYGRDYRQIYDILAGEIFYQRNESFDAMVRITSAIPVLEKNKNYVFLCVALYIQTSILAINGEVKSAGIIMTHLRDRVKDIDGSIFDNNIDAMAAKLALYEGDLEFINDWFKHKAPDENEEFNLIDAYRYFIKLRCYLLYDKHLALMSLAERLKVYFEQSHRYIDLIGVSCLEAMSWYKTGRKDRAFEIMKVALKYAEQFQLIRVIADEGILMFKLLQDYQRERGTNPFLSKLIDVTRHVAVLYPDYLNITTEFNLKFTEMEKDILRLLEQGKTYDEIAEMFYISVNTVRYHIKKIYPKLDVTSSSQAIFKAKKMGII